jgi:hypothetical protein
VKLARNCCCDHSQLPDVGGLPYCFWYSLAKVPKSLECGAPSEAIASADAYESSLGWDDWFRMQSLGRPCASGAMHKVARGDLELDGEASFKSAALSDGIPYADADEFSLG